MADSTSNPSPRLVRACRNEVTDRPPVWLMRQAGRYMAEYRAVREKVSFLELCKHTELATEVSLQPYKAFKTDGVIMFSDILIPPEAMGMEVVFGDGGPSFPNPIRHADDIERLIIPDPNEKTGFVMDLLKSLRHELRDDQETGLVGFAGSPWTLAVYMVEGGGSRHFARIKGLMYEAPELLDKLLHKLTVTITHYLNAQIEAGAQVVQLFDTWAGILSAEEYRRFILPCHQAILANLKRDKAPAILYVNNSRGLIPMMVEAKPDVISVDSLTSLTETRKIIGSDIALQGNLDPILLLGNSDILDRRVQELLREGGNQGYIFNLGHGILPPTPPENVRLVVNRVKESAALYWSKSEDAKKEENSSFAQADQDEKTYYPSPEQEEKHRQTLEAAAGHDEKPEQKPQAAQASEQPEANAQQEPQTQEQQKVPVQNQEQGQVSVQPDQKAREQAPQAQSEKQQPAPKQNNNNAPEPKQANQEQPVITQEQPQTEAQNQPKLSAPQPEQQSQQRQAEPKKPQVQNQQQKPAAQSEGQPQQTQVQAQNQEHSAPSAEQQAQNPKSQAQNQQRQTLSPIDQQAEADLKAQAVQNDPKSYQADSDQNQPEQASQQNNADLLSIGEAESKRAQAAVESDEETAEANAEADAQTQQAQNNSGQPAKAEQAVTEFPDAAETLANQASSFESASQPVERIQSVSAVEKVGPSV